MNERIKLLAEKSGFLLWEDEPWKPEGAIVDWSSQYDGELERFAELIVAECLDIVEDEDDGSADTKAIRWAMIRIKKHFGVEE